MSDKNSVADLDNLYPIREFTERFPRIAPTQNSLRWHLRDRETNGMLKSGAVVTMNHKIFINADRFAAWLLERSTGSGRTA